MSDELERNPNKRDTSPKNERQKKNIKSQQKELHVKKKYGMGMNIMKLPRMNPTNESSYTDLRFHRKSESDRSLFKTKLEEKLSELLDEQRALTELYAKAAKAAKEKEKEYRERIAQLIEQTDKDNQLMDLFRNL